MVRFRTLYVHRVRGMSIIFVSIGECPLAVSIIAVFAKIERMTDRRMTILKKMQALTSVAVAIGLISSLSLGEAWAQLRDDSSFGTRGRPSTVLDLMKRNRAANAPAVRQPPGSVPVRRPPGFTTGSSSTTSSRQIVSPGAEEPILPETPTKSVETPTQGVSTEAVPKFPKPEEPAAETGVTESEQPMQAPAEEGSPPAEATHNVQPPAE